MKKEYVRRRLIFYYVTTAIQKKQTKEKTEKPNEIFNV